MWNKKEKKLIKPRFDFNLGQETFRRHPRKTTTSTICITTASSIFPAERIWKFGIIAHSVDVVPDGFCKIFQVGQILCVWTRWVGVILLLELNQSLVVPFGGCLLLLFPLREMNDKK